MHTQGKIKKESQQSCDVSNRKKWEKTERKFSLLLRHNLSRHIRETQQAFEDSLLQLNTNTAGDAWRHASRHFWKNLIADFD
jgi:hypothetical protein